MEFINKIINIVYPKRCPFCDKIIKEPFEICEECKKIINLKFIKRKIFLDGNVIVCVSPFKYTGNIAESIKRFKFRNRKDYAKTLSKFMVTTFNEFFLNENIDIITAVPLHPRKKSQRGYNQAELLAKNISNNVNIPYKNILRKNKINLQQHDLSYEERVNNVNVNKHDAIHFSGIAVIRGTVEVSDSIISATENAKYGISYHDLYNADLTLDGKTVAKVQTNSDILKGEVRTADYTSGKQDTVVINGSLQGDRDNMTGEYTLNDLKAENEI